MDVALDINDQGMFYKGTAMIPRGFHSPAPFQIDFDLAHWSHPWGGGIGFDTHAILGDTFTKSGEYEPNGNGTGTVRLARGKVELRGSIQQGGTVLDGDWFFNGQRGGGFRIAPKGSIFP